MKRRLATILAAVALLTATAVPAAVAETQSWSWGPCNDGMTMHSYSYMYAYHEGTSWPITKSKMHWWGSWTNRYKKTGMPFGQWPAGGTALVESSDVTSAWNSCVPY